MFLLLLFLFFDLFSFVSRLVWCAAQAHFDLLILPPQLPYLWDNNCSSQLSKCFYFMHIFVSLIWDHTLLCCMLCGVYVCCVVCVNVCESPEKKVTINGCLYECLWKLGLTKLIHMRGRSPLCMVQFPMQEALNSINGEMELSTAGSWLWRWRDQLSQALPSWLPCSDKLQPGVMK